MKNVMLFFVSFLMVGTLIGCVSSSTVETIPESSDVEIFEDFEEIHYFIAVGDFWNDGDNSLVAITTEDHATSGDKALECQFLFQENKKGAAFYGEGFEKMDWSGYSKLIVDVYNATDTELTFAFAVCTGSSWDWIESETFPLPAGMNNNYTFDLTSKTYKNGASNWENTINLADMDDVKRLIYKINGPAGLEGSVYFDNIRLAK